MFNKIPVLDKGFVALLGSSPSDEFIRAVMYDNEATFLRMATASLIVKCPLFVQLHLGRFDLNLTCIVSKEAPAEAYVPTEAEVQAKDLETSQMIAADISNTTAALLINPSAYQFEGCDQFVSQVISPISVYNELVVNGTLKQWIDFTTQTQKLPEAIEAYRKVVEDILIAEWDTLRPWIKRDDSKKR